MTILIIGNSKDHTLQHFARFLHRQRLQKHSYLFLNEEALGRTVFFTNTHIISHSKKLNFNAISSVWSRLLSPPPKSCSKRLSHYYFCHFLLDEVWTHVVNRPKYCTSNFAKLAQLESIQLKYIKTPPSLLSNCISDCMNIKALHQGAWVFKSSSYVRSIVKVLDTRSLTTNNHKLHESVLFQERLSGLNIRVHVVSDYAVVVSCKSTEVDYRYDKKTIISSFTLPLSIKKECIDVCKSLNLYLAGIDLIRVGSEYFLLEVNTCPGFEYFDKNDKVCSVLHSLLTKSKISL